MHTGGLTLSMYALERRQAAQGRYLRSLLARRWTVRSWLASLALCVLVAGCPSGAGAASTGRPIRAGTPKVVTPSTVPNSTLSGAGAFMGPVHQVPDGKITIGYRQFGRGPSLLLVTGDTAPMSLWPTYLLQPLARHFRVTIFDNRGVGYSTDSLSQQMTVPLLAQDTAGLITVLGLHRPTVVGWSMGGEIAITLEETHAALLGKVVTSGGDAGSSHTVPPPPKMIAALNTPNAPVSVALNLLFPSTPAGKAATKRFVANYLAVPQETVSSTTLARQLQAELAFLKYDGVWDKLGAIHTPTLVTNGAVDKGVPPINARRLATRIPGAELGIYAGCAHGMMFQDAAKFVAQVVHFADDK